MARGRYRTAPHHRALSDALVDSVVRKPSPSDPWDVNRLLVSMPPRHGKSETASHWFPVWLLELFPGLRIALVSYQADFAVEWGARVRDTILQNADNLTVRIASGSARRSKWMTTAGGGMTCVGIGGGLTGKGADVLLIDDALKNREEADSTVIRRRNQRWYTGTAYPRLEEPGTVVVIETRWHHDDLSGYLLAQQEQHERSKTDEPFDRWRSINFAALAGDEDSLGRAPGEALWPSSTVARAGEAVPITKYPVERLLRIRRALGPHDWASLYQGDPQPDVGAMFRSSWFRYHRMTAIDGSTVFELFDGTTVRRFPVTACRWFQTVDTAVEVGQTNDYTVIGTFAKTPDNDLLVVEMARDRVLVPEQLPWVLNRRKAWPLVRWTAIEKKQSGHGILQAAKLLGFPLRILEADASKTMRATPASVLYENGAVFHLEAAPWVADLEAELLDFPSGRHDDMVDVLAYAARKIRRRTSEAIKLL